MQCADLGWSVLLLEREEYSGKSSACGGLLSKAACMEFINEPDIVEQEINQTDFVFPWGTSSVDLPLVTVQRCRFDRHLAENAGAAGATVLHNTVVTDFEVVSTGNVVVEAKRRNPDEQFKARARICVFADGPASISAKMPVFDPEQYKRYWSFAFAYEVEGVTMPGNVCKIFLDPDFIQWGYSWIFPDKDQMNVGLGTILPEMKKPPGLKQSLQHFLTDYPLSKPYLKGQKVLRKNGGIIPMHPQKQIYDDSVVLTGDAAGMVTAMFGAGLDFSLQASKVLADVLNKALRANDCSKKVLSEYQEKAYPNIMRELKRQSNASKLIIASMKAHRTLPIKLLSVLGFGDYNRWNKIKTVFYPALGTPTNAKAAVSETALNIKP